MKTLSVILISCAMVLASTNFTQKKARILIIGDSISNGYTPFVKESMKDVAEVYHNPGNAKHTGHGLEHIESWLAQGEWDIVQFNWGLWDLCYRHPDSKVQGNRDKVNGKITFNAEDYRSNLDSIVGLIRKSSDAELIFVTTSYVPEHEAGRFAKDAILYNEVAKKVMKAHNVKINDIYKISKKIHLKYGKGNDDVHYTPKGYEEMGKHIADFLKQKIK